MSSAAASGPSDHTTLTAVVDSYRESGFAGDFWVEDDGTVRCGRCQSVIDPKRLEMHSLRRLEGASDPADMVSVVATTCPVCGADGTLVLSYGPMAAAGDARVSLALRDARRDQVLPADASPDDLPDDLSGTGGASTDELRGSEPTLGDERDTPPDRGHA